MSRKKTKSSPPYTPTHADASWLQRHAFWLFMGLAAVAAIGAVSYFTRAPGNGFLTASAPQPIAPTVQKAFTFNKLLAMKPEELKDVDIAEMNLLCATGLPGAEKLDVAKCMKKLDEWAAKVKAETERNLYRLSATFAADEYHHSEVYLRSSMLLQVLQEDLGVKYNMTAKDNFDFKDSSVAFIHGMIPAPGQTTAQTPGGTCASMPVLYTAVGRRLGYPLKLVTTKAHLFVRWDGKDNPNPAWRERLNIEGAGHGFSSFDDNYYKTWPHKVTEAEVQANGWLVSLTPKEELAEFLASRGHCLLDNGHPKEAFDSYTTAHALIPQDPAYSSWMRQAEVRFRPPQDDDLEPWRYSQSRPDNRLDQRPDVKAVIEYNRRITEQLSQPPPPNGPQPQPGVSPWP